MKSCRENFQLGQVRQLPIAVVLLMVVTLLLSACGANNAATTAPVANTTTVVAATTTSSAVTTSNSATSTPVVIATAPAITASNTTTTVAATSTTAVATANTTPANATTAPATTSTSDATAPGAAATPNGTPLPVPTTTVSDTARQALQTVAQQTAQERGLQFDKTVPINFMTRDQLGTYQVASFKRDNPPALIDQQTKEWQVMGFIKPGFDLTKTETDLLTEQILGFYDPETKQFYVIVDNGNPNQPSLLIKFTTSHELTHALQDQRFNLLKIRPNRTPNVTAWNDDYDYAVTGLIEGDAVQSQSVWLQNGVKQGYISAGDIAQLQKDVGSFSQDQINSAPPIISETLEFPYNEGWNFVQKLYSNGGWAAVDKAWTSGLPQSTSQILHTDKYFNHVAPVKVDMPQLTDTLGSGWKAIDINTLGELQARIWLEGPDKKITPQTDAATAVSGWAGDRYEVVSDANGNYGYALRSQWDSESNATTFFNAALKYMQPTYGLQGDGGSGQSRTWTTGTQNVVLTQKGNQVLVVVMPKGDAASKVVSKLGF